MFDITLSEPPREASDLPVAWRVRIAGERPRPLGDRPTMLGDCLLGERLASPSLKLSDAARTLRGIERLLLFRHGGPCVTDDAGAYLDTCPAVPRGPGPRARADLRMGATVGRAVRARARSAAQRELLARLRTAGERAAARFRAERRRYCGRLSIHEAKLETCFDTGMRNKRGRYGLVSVERPAHVRRAEHEAARDRRKKAKRMRRAAYEAQAKADQHEAERLGITYEAARNRRRRAEKRRPYAGDQVRPQTQGACEFGVTLGRASAPSGPVGLPRRRVGVQIAPLTAGIELPQLATDGGRRNKAPADMTNNGRANIMINGDRHGRRQREARTLDGRDRRRSGSRVPGLRGGELGSTTATQGAGIGSWASSLQSVTSLARFGHRSTEA